MVPMADEQRIVQTTRAVRLLGLLLIIQVTLWRGSACNCDTILAVIVRNNLEVSNWTRDGSSSIASEKNLAKLTLAW